MLPDRAGRFFYMLLRPARQEAAAESLFAESSTVAANWAYIHLPVALTQAAGLNNGFRHWRSMGLFQVGENQSEELATAGTELPAQVIAAALADHDTPSVAWEP